MLMIPLMLCSLICLAVVYDRWFAFRENRRIDTRSLRSKVLARLRENDIPGAIRECEAARGPVASVLLAGLRSYHQLRGKQEGAETMRLVVGQVMEDYSAKDVEWGVRALLTNTVSDDQRHVQFKCDKSQPRETFQPVLQAIAEAVASSKPSAKTNRNNSDS